jgi:hypothetical protein
MQLLHANKWQQNLEPHHTVECIFPVRWHPARVEAKCELLYGGQNLPKGATELRYRIYLLVKAATDMETELCITPFKLFIMTHVHGGTVFAENDSGNETSKPFSS